jgi:hypothetical protein
VFQLADLGEVPSRAPGQVTRRQRGVKPDLAQAGAESEAGFLRLAGHLRSARQASRRLSYGGGMHCG